MPGTNSKEERDLLLLVSTGDERAFARIYDLHRPNMYTTALRITGSVQAAEEIVQDVFLKLWLKRSELPGVQNFAGWLYVVAQRYTLNALKNLQKNTGFLAPLGMTIGTTEQSEAEEKLQGKQLGELLQQAIALLPEKQRETFQLIKMDGLTREDAAARMGVSSETVKSNLDHAVRRVRAFLLKNLDFLTPIAILSIVFN